MGNCAGCEQKPKVQYSKEDPNVKVGEYEGCIYINYKIGLLRLMDKKIKPLDSDDALKLAFDVVLDAQVHPQMRKIVIDRDGARRIQFVDQPKVLGDERLEWLILQKMKVQEMIEDQSIEDGMGVSFNLLVYPGMDDRIVKIYDRLRQIGKVSSS